MASAQWLAWHSGLMRARHVRQHAETLTVFGLHRVLRRDDPRWVRAMPEWTVEDVTFRTALEFIAANYNVVTLSAVVQALKSGVALPPRAALITFDDGWADTADTAAPILREMGLPAVLFVISGLVGAPHGTWESEWYAVLQKATDAELNEVRNLYLPGTAVNLRTEGGLESLARVLRQRPLEERFRRIREHFGALVDVGLPEMVTTQDLVTLVKQGVEIGAHTVSHDSLVGMPAAQQEITGSFEALRAMVAPYGGKVQGFSFPHGSYDRSIVEAVARAGADACFSSDLGLVSTPGGRPQGFLMGRVWIGRSLCSASGRLMPHRAAWRYFRTDIRPADGVGSGHWA